MKIIVLFGPPGSGKGTQAKNLATRYGYAHISTGDILLSLSKRNDPLAENVKGYINQGLLVPDELILDLFQETFKTTFFGSPAGIILDGFPRTLSQLETLAPFLSTIAKFELVYIHLDVPREELIARLLRRATIEHRADDTIDVINDRMNTYTQKTKPIIDALESSHLLHTVSGTGKTIEEVFGEVRNLLSNIRW